MRFQQHLKESFFNDCNFGSKAVNLLKHIKEPMLYVGCQFLLKMTFFRRHFAKKPVLARKMLAVSQAKECCIHTTSVGGYLNFLLFSSM